MASPKEILKVCGEDHRHAFWAVYHTPPRACCGVFPNNLFETKRNSKQGRNPVPVLRP